MIFFDFFHILYKNPILFTKSLNRFELQLIRFRQDLLSMT
nr:MAG TPA: hypothetical protein [Crassvirales sp.]DAQ87934.1 MAG TPA: hypothetical protein [Caudoviricetes sp.]